MAQGAGGGGDLFGVVLDPAVAQIPRLDVQRDRLGGFELVVGQRVAGLLELGLGGLVVAGLVRGRRHRGLGPGLVEVGGRFGRGVVEEAPVHVHAPDLLDQLHGLVIVALAHLLAGRLEPPPRLLLDVGGLDPAGGDTGLLIGGGRP